jgi:hypothetical protein
VGLLLGIAIYAAAIGCLSASIRMAIRGCEEHPKSIPLRLLTHPGWCFLLLAALPHLAGAFARCETSPIPWETFSMECSRHGFLNGLFAVIEVLTVDLWLFWIPAHLWIMGSKNGDRGKRIMARVINVLVGMLILTPANPVYRLLGM